MQAIEVSLRRLGTDHVDLYMAHRPDLTVGRLAAVERLRPWVAQRGRGLAELGIAWLLAHEVCATVIVGLRTRSQIDENVRAAEWRVSAAERDEARRVALGNA